MSGSCPPVKRPRTVCHLQSLPDLPALKAWASSRGAAVAYLGPDGQGHAMYGAFAGPDQRVAVVADEPDPHRSPVQWKTPILRLPRVRVAS